jgi:hypothetical protein
MSTPFYDLASLVVVPSGYKASKVYAQKPQTTDGQLAFADFREAWTRNDGLMNRCVQILNPIKLPRTML